MEDELSFDFESGLSGNSPRAAAAAAQQNGAQQPAVPVIIQPAGPPPPGAPGYVRNHRQTVCTYWLRGLCMRGDACSFLHQYNKDRMPVCRTFAQTGQCNEPDCPYKHAREDIKECNMYKLGFCVYGPHCRYRHTWSEGPPPPPAQAALKLSELHRMRARRAEQQQRQAQQVAAPRPPLQQQPMLHNSAQQPMLALPAPSGPGMQQGPMQPAGPRPPPGGPRPPPGNPPPQQQQQQPQLQHQQQQQHWQQHQHKQQQPQSMPNMERFPSPFVGSAVGLPPPFIQPQQGF